MTEIAQTTGIEPAAREAYAFACMRCGHGWEQAYEIVHRTDGKGEPHVVYYADGERVPSPLTRPSCRNCGGDVVRIMRSGQVSKVSHAIENMHQRRNDGAKAEKTERVGKAERPEKGMEAVKGGRAARSEDAAGDGEAAERGRHHWHLSDLLHPFQHHHRR
ncbi:hypothetical protein SSP35_08_01430 [Streptomyces sp. NBRC 110611]|uniref:hypothetical protein n=1 Tax=Streptomyces sp. NBRC 110611 TaxID=1621259 RepID=UPI00082A09C3|nr:hypothetical protein [Streptomyces sp. NBRC 110611]GAU68649.1 hypothetical protein SSP35_08_01430 [Streptomyces sp. NBRC 110611]